MRLMVRTIGYTWTHLSLEQPGGPRYIDILQISTGKRHFNGPLVAPI